MYAPHLDNGIAFDDQVIRQRRWNFVRLPGMVVLQRDTVDATCGLPYDAHFHRGMPLHRLLVAVPDRVF